MGLLQYAIVDTDWGAFAFVALGGRLVRTFLPQRKADNRRMIRQQCPDAVEASDLFPRFQREVVDYFAGKPTRFTAKLDVSDQPTFRQAVLEQCRRIPYGKTASYGDLARAVGNPGAVRAVGGAMGNNPLPLVVPWHRVVCSDGSFGGFSTPKGVKEKTRMLALENAIDNDNDDSARSLRTKSAYVIRTPRIVS